MLLPLAVLGLPGVAAWLDRVETLGPLPPVVAAAVAGPPRTVETGVLDLTTAAEGLARRLWPDWNRLTEEGAAAALETALAAVAEQGDEVVDTVRGALQHLREPSYPKRLLRLAERADDVVPKVVGRRTEEGRPSRWKNAVVSARNDFAHRLDRGWLDEERLDQYLAVIGSLSPRRHRRAREPRYRGPRCTTRLAGAQPSAGPRSTRPSAPPACLPGERRSVRRR